MGGLTQLGPSGSLSGGAGDFGITATGSDDSGDTTDDADTSDATSGAFDFGTTATGEGSGDTSDGSQADDSDGDDRIDWDDYKKDVKTSGSVKVGGETVKDYSEGVQTTGSVDATDPTSIYEADESELQAAGFDSDGEKNTTEDVQEFVETRDQNEGGGSEASESNSDGPSSSTSGSDNSGGGDRRLLALGAVAVVALIALSGGGPS